MITAMSEVLFREVQRFRQPWLWLLLLAGLLPAVLIIGVGVVEQILLGRPFGDRPLPDGALLAVFASVAAFAAVLLRLFHTARLVTEVRPDGLWVQFVPFHRVPRHIDGIATFAARDYAPIREYGGWGLRWGGRRGWVYNVSGRRGVQLELRGGGKLLIGSGKPEELERALARVLGVERP